MELKQKAELKAVEYAEGKKIKTDCIRFIDTKKHYYDGYIAGATENGIQWHDLRKNPNDLPDTDRFVHVQTMSDTGKAYYDDGWYSGGINGIVIAWCEEPQFKG